MSELKQLIKERHRNGKRFESCGQELRRKYLKAAISDNPKPLDDHFISQIVMSGGLANLIIASIDDNETGGYCMERIAVNTYWNKINDAMIERDAEIIADLKASANPGINKASGF